MSTLVISLLSSFLLFSPSQGSRGSCLFGKKQNLIPTTEPDLRECQQYSENACCSQDQTNAPPRSPFPWDVCGHQSPRCELYVKRVQCMYLCSPHISVWAEPTSPTGIQELPLCHRFCDQWFDACKQDLICRETANSAANCSQDCATYKQVFVSGRQLCDNIWGHSFVAVSKPCFCITPSGQEEELPQDTAPEQPDNQEGASGSPEQCLTVPPKRRARRAFRKKSVFVEDVEGSGSGF